MISRSLFIGLGNPGSVYRFNRHNIGALLIEVIQKEYAFPKLASWKNSMISESSIETVLKQNNSSTSSFSEHKLLLAIPTNYMNNSGQSVAEIVNFYDINLDNVLVVHDDIDLLPGEIKIKKGGGSGGHNGLRSIDSSIGNDYWRLRIGIGHPGHKDLVSSYVLSNFTSSEKVLLEPLLNNIANELPTFFIDSKEAFIKKIKDVCNNSCMN